MGKVNKVLWNLRQDLEKNCSEMSRMFGVTDMAWWKWEKNGVIPTEKTREKIAKHFGLTVDEIWPGKGLIQIVTVNGISHVMRSTGELYCKRPQVVGVDSMGSWDDVTCPRCQFEKFGKYRRDKATQAGKLVTITYSDGSQKTLPQGDMWGAT